MKDLFTPLTRDERQDESVRKWLQNKGKGTVVAATGVGKTRIAIKCIQKLRQKYPNIAVLVLVPTELLKNQWTEELDAWGLGFNTEVKVMMGASKKEYHCDMLIIDEAHRINSELIANTFQVVKYKLILGLTATFERLDGRHEILAKYAPVCDTISVEEAVLNNWVSKYKDYVVLIDVDDIDVYKQYNKEFVEHFEFFQFDFNKAMSMIGPKGLHNRLVYRDELCGNDESKKKEVLKNITYHATGFIRAIQNRKKFVQNHPEKLRLTEEIIKYRPDSKIITFSANTKMAESIKEGYVYTGKEGKKKNRMTLEEFSALPSGVLNTVKLAEEGMNLPDLSVGIMLGVNSSKTKAIQTLGRVIRLSKDKTAEFFTLVINNSIETEWMKKSRIDNNFIIIDSENLMKVLRGEPYETYKKKLQNFTFRF
jgi:superfamily II DNA or RNA helicase